MLESPGPKHHLPRAERLSNFVTLSSIQLAVPMSEIGRLCRNAEQHARATPANKQKAPTANNGPNQVDWTVVSSILISDGACYNCNSSFSFGIVLFQGGGFMQPVSNSSPEQGFFRCSAVTASDQDPAGKGNPVSWTQAPITWTHSFLFFSD